MIQPIEHMRTLDGCGTIMPWYTRPCLEWLDTIDFNGLDVFEFGCGKSSDWFDARGALTFGVDHQKEWTPKQCGYICANDKTMYLNFIGSWYIKYDFIIIDGIHRDDCTEHALRHLKPGGYLIADNFEQASADLPDWPKTRELTKHLPLTLYKEPGHIDWQTAVWHNV